MFLDLVTKTLYAIRYKIKASSWRQTAVVLSRYVSFMHKVHEYTANSLWTLSGMVTVCLITNDMFSEILPATNILERCRWSRFRDPDITLPFYSLAMEFFGLWKLTLFAFCFQI